MSSGSNRPSAPRRPTEGRIQIGQVDLHGTHQWALTGRRCHWWSALSRPSATCPPNRCGILLPHHSLIAANSLSSRSFLAFSHVIVHFQPAHFRSALCACNTEDLPPKMYPAQARRPQGLKEGCIKIDQIQSIRRPKMMDFILKMVDLMLTFRFFPDRTAPIPMHEQPRPDRSARCQHLLQALDE